MILALEFSLLPLWDLSLAPCLLIGLASAMAGIQPNAHA
jgi:hypothetical protein